MKKRDNNMFYTFFWQFTFNLCFCQTLCRSQVGRYTYRLYFFLTAQNDIHSNIFHMKYVNYTKCFLLAIKIFF